MIVIDTIASRSPVFAKMFSSDMLESATNTLYIPDIEPDVLKERAIAHRFELIDKYSA